MADAARRLVCPPARPRALRAVDLFGGAGGFGLSAELEGVDVLWAGNHNDLAVSTYRANHPGTEVVCQDMSQADFTLLPRYDLLLAGPACQGHSTASQPKRRHYHDAQRSTVWAVVECAEVTEPRYIAVENVPPFLKWKLFPRWRQCLEDLGYHVTVQTVRASYCGVPQRRDRVFILGSLDGPVSLLVPKTEEPPFGPCIDWDAPGWRRIADCRGEDARIRLRNASRRYGQALSQHVTNHPGLALTQSIRTITGASCHWCLVDHDWYRYLTTRELARAQGFPDSYVWPDGPQDQVNQAIGNAVAVGAGRRVARRFVEAAGLAAAA